MIGVLKNISIVFIVHIMCSFQIAGEKYVVTGLQGSYKMCDSVSFKLKNIGDTCQAYVIIGVERKHGKKWVSFVDDIQRETDNPQTIGGYFIKRGNSIFVVWHPCKMKQFADCDLKLYFKGQFRFKFITGCNGKLDYSNDYSSPFKIKRS